MKSQPAEVVSLESSLSELRDPTQYVGLKNLGATFYVNSLIQMWFHNEDMRYAIYVILHWIYTTLYINKFNDNRRIIYKWDITEDPEEKEALYQTKKAGLPYHPATAVGQLQYIFAMMQFGNRSLLDPINLAVALSLDTRTQQDAQEFSKLLLCHIEGKLGQNSELKKMLQRLTQGKYSYINWWVFWSGKQMRIVLNDDDADDLDDENMVGHVVRYDDWRDQLIWQREMTS